MSSVVQRSDENMTESEWLEFPDPTEMSPASIWTVDEEDEEITIQCKRVVVTEERITSRPPRLLDESQGLPDEASFATVRLNQPVESIESNDHEPIAKRNTRFEVKVDRPVRVLDESCVLPGEASFATVRLNQPIESIDSNDYERMAKRNTRFEVEVDRPVRVLDESYVLPAEASFATVASNDRNHARSYSPVTEFFAKSNLKIFAVIALSLFSVSAAATLAVLKFKDEVVSSAPMVNNPREVSLPAAPQEETPVADSESLESTAVSQKQSEVRVVQAQKDKAGSPQRQSQARHVSRAEKTVTIERKDGKTSRAGTVATGERASLKESATQSNDEIISPPATGGGQRPRTVTRRNP